MYCTYIPLVESSGTTDDVNQGINIMFGARHILSEHAHFVLLLSEFLFKFLKQQRKNENLGKRLDNTIQIVIYDNQF